MAAASPSASRAATTTRRVQASASVYPEWGTYPGGAGESPIVPMYDPKNAEREVIHGRFAMLAVTGAYTAEQATGVPWYEAGALCTPDDCTALIDAFPLAIAGVNAPPEAAGNAYYFGYVFGLEFLLVGLAELYRTGAQPFGDDEKVANPFPELTQGISYPGGRFDPLGFSNKYDLEELKIKELKHCRLAMGAWLGCIGQAFATSEGPYKNLADHLGDPVHNNIFTKIGTIYG